MRRSQLVKLVRDKVGIRAIGFRLRGNGYTMEHRNSKFQMLLLLMSRVSVIENQ